jgi:hypothetical protein
MRSLLISGTLSLLLLGCGENIEAHYSTYAELHAADSGARSWMPQWLPRSATDIRDWHNLDSNGTLIAFTVPRATSALLEGCRPTSEAKNPVEQSSWWPDDQAFAKLQHFDCEERVTYADGRVEVRRAGAATDSQRNRIYFWR